MHVGGHRLVMADNVVLWALCSQQPVSVEGSLDSGHGLGSVGVRRGHGARDGGLAEGRGKGDSCSSPCPRSFPSSSCSWSRRRRWWWAARGIASAWWLLASGQGPRAGALVGWLETRLALQRLCSDCAATRTTSHAARLRTLWQCFEKGGFAFASGIRASRKRPCSPSTAPMALHLFHNSGSRATGLRTEHTHANEHRALDIERLLSSLHAIIAAAGSPLHVHALI